MTKTGGNSGGAQFAFAVGTTAVTLTVPTAAQQAVIDNSGTQAIRYTTDGSTPTTTSGNRLVAGAQLDWSNPDVNYRALMVALQMISESATTGSTAEVQYYVYS